MKMRTIDDLPEISFIGDITYEDKLNELRNSFLEKKQELTGKEASLLPTDDMSIVLNAISLEFYQMYRVIEDGFRKNLLKYSSGSSLEGLGMFKNCDRAEPSKARCKVRFTLSEVQEEEYIIPSGTEIIKDNIVFATSKDCTIEEGGLMGDVLATCKRDGEIGNGILAGELRTLVVPLPYVQKVENIETSYGGKDEENDIDYANRILNSIHGRSVGGTEPSYEYFCKQADGDIQDVHVKTVLSSDGLPKGEVDIFLLYPNNLQSEFQERIARIQKYLNENGIRISTDKLNFKEARKVSIKYNLSYYIKNEDEPGLEQIKARITHEIEQYQDKITSSLGRVYEEDELFAILIKNGCKNITRQGGAEYNTIHYKKFSENEAADFSECVLTYSGLTSEITGSIKGG